MLEELKTKNWYYMQVFGGGEGYVPPLYFVVFAKDKDTARKLAREYADGRGYTGEMHFYLKTYKREARALVSMGQYVTEQL